MTTVTPLAHVFEFLPSNGPALGEVRKARVWRSSSVVTLTVENVVMSTSAERMRALRARRAAAIEPAEDARPGELAPSVEQTLAALDLDDKDAAAAQLAAVYAQVIDQARDSAWAARWIGPLLLQALAELHATPASRKAGKPKEPAKRVPTRVAQLRQAHASTSKRVAG